MFFIEIIPYKYIINRMHEEAKAAVKEELKEQVQEMQNDLLIMMNEQITEELIERKEKERVKEATNRMCEEMIKYYKARKRIEAKEEAEAIN